MRPILLPLLLLAVSVGAFAQTVWRCGPDGRQYAEQPCEAGRAIAVADARSAGEIRAAREVAASEQALAASLASQRLARERDSRMAGSGLAGFDAPRRAELKGPKVKAKAKPNSKPRHPKPTAAPDTFRAVAPASR